MAHFDIINPWESMPLNITKACFNFIYILSMTKPLGEQAITPGLKKEHKTQTQY